jgi:tRNA U34 5-carboxymethylaminomethyl modifying GTPase MnmE/TrmE
MLDAFESKRLAVLSALADLGSLAEDIGARSMADKVRAGLAAKLEADRFHLVVVGEFNHGKTTLVNALLGEPVLPVGVTPTTAVIHQIDWAESPSASVLYESGLERTLSFGEVAAFALGHPAPDPDPGPVRLLRIGYPAPLLRGHIALVDTPGVNDLSLQRADITYSYSPQSDAVLFLLDAGQLLKASERVFLQDHLLAQSRDKIVFVVTKKDILSDSELEEAMRYVGEHLATLVRSPNVFAVSAEQAAQGRREGSGLEELVGFLTRFLEEERGRILLDNSLGEALGGCATIAKGLDAKRRGLEMSVVELDRRTETIERELAGHAKTLAERRIGIREQVAAIKAWTRRDLERLVEDVTSQIPAIVDDAEVADLKVHLGPFLERSLRDWAQAETREVAEALEALADKTVALVREDARAAADRLAGVLGRDMKAPPIEVDSFVYDVGVPALAAVGFGVALMLGNWLLGGVLVLAVPVLALLMRGRLEAETRERAKQLAPQAVRDAAARVGPKLDEMIDEFGQRLDAWVVSASEEVYREVLEVLRTARVEREHGDEATATAVSLCDRQQEALGKLRERLERMRSELWVPAQGSGEAG